MMKNENLLNYSADHYFDSGFPSHESGYSENSEQFFKVYDEMNKFIQNLNHSRHCSTIPDQVHFLHLSLLNLENAEKELITSNLTEESLYQEKIIEDIRSLKVMVLNYIRDLSSEMNHED
jgi:hypothetical protein